MKIPYVKRDAIEFVLSVLNDFHKNIKFTYETDGSGEINFLDVTLLQKRKDTELNYIEHQHTTICICTGIL